MLKKLFLVFLFVWYVFSLRWGLILSHMLECGGMQLGPTAPLTSGDPPASASQVAGITDISHPAWLVFFLFLVEMGFHYVGQAGFELIISSDLTASASKSARITGLSHFARP